jgi:hypothetical protein
MAVQPFPRAGAFAVLKTTGQVGIIHEFPQQNPVGTEDRDGKTHPIITLDQESCAFHTLKADGSTDAELRNVPVSEVRQAKAKEIPSKRRPTAAQIVKFGY